jgi:nicotinamidase-related amidase
MKTALLLIDIQEGMFMEETPYHGDELLANAALLLDRARAAGIPVFHVRHDGGPGDVLEKGTAGWQTHAAVAPRKNEHIIDKAHCSSFVDTGLDAELRGLGIGNLVIAGMQTEYCIDTACRVAHSLGYTVTLVEDAHSTFDSKLLTAPQIIEHHSQLLRNRFARMQPSRDIQFNS